MLASFDRWFAPRRITAQAIMLAGAFTTLPNCDL
jgi:hypothetical protein